MNARRLNIGIRSGAQRSKALRETMRRIARGDETSQEPELYFENAASLLTSNGQLAVLLVKLD